MKFFKKISHIVMSSMTICLIIIAWNFLYTYNVYNFFSENYSSQQPIVNSWTDTFDFVEINEFKSTKIVTECRQILDGDSNDMDTTIDFHREKTIQFNQNIKSCYLGPEVSTIENGKILNDISQLTPYDTSNNTGSYNGDDFDYDIDRRVQNWNDTYNQYLCVEFSNLTSSWQRINPEFYLNTQVIWPNSCDYKNINCQIQFEKNGVKDQILKNGSEIIWNVGFDRNLYTGNSPIIAAPMCKIKEVLHFYLFYNFVDRFVWTLSGSETVSGKSLLYQAQTDDITNCYRFDLNNVVSFENASLSNNGGFVVLGINQGFIKTAYEIKENNKLIDELSSSDIKNKEILIDLLSALSVGTDNFELLYDYIVVQNVTDPIKINQILQQNTSELAALASKYNLTINSDAFGILEQILDKLTFVINYSTPNKSNPKVYDNYIKKYTYTDLLNQPVIQLNKNCDGNYEIIINDFYNEELVSSNVFISSVHDNIIANNSPFITQEDSKTYIINNPTNVKVDFVNIDNPSVKNYYPSEKSDKEILQQFTRFYDEYNNTIPVDLISHDKYEIFKDDVNGEVHIKIILSNEEYWQEIYGFKQMPNFNSEALNAMAIGNDRLIASDTDENILGEILLTNGYDQYVIDTLSFESNVINDEDGTASFKITHEYSQGINDYYEDQNLMVINFSRFYFRQKQQIDQVFLEMKPSDITKEIFLASFVEFTPEFYNRCFSHLKIKLSPDDKNYYLKVNVSVDNYPKIGVYEAIFEYTFAQKEDVKTENSNENLPWIIIGGSTGAMLLGGGCWYCYKKIKK